MQSALTHPELPDPTGTRPRRPWERWEEMALAAGVPDVLAGLGRGVMERAHERGWDLELMGEYGWGDEGQTMLWLALRCPTEARRRWVGLLVSDGYRRQPE